MLQIILREVSSEKCISYILQPGAWAYQPLNEKLKQIKIPINFMYGKSDFMSRNIPD